jgi:hypothetical protein
LLAPLVASLWLIALPPSVRPTPIGSGRGFQPPAAPPAVGAGAPTAGLRCSRAPRRRFRVHVELFARRRVIIVPAGVGVARPLRRVLGRVVPGGCSYELRTLEPTGVVEVAAGRPLTLGALFRLWGQPFGPYRLASFRSARQLLAFVGGRRWHGDPRTIPLTPRAQIVLELGGYVPPHPRYAFAPGR